MYAMPKVKKKPGTPSLQKGAKPKPITENAQKVQVKKKPGLEQHEVTRRTKLHGQIHHAPPGPKKDNKNKYEFGYTWLKIPSSDHNNKLGTIDLPKQGGVLAPIIFENITKSFLEGKHEIFPATYAARWKKYIRTKN